MDDILEANDNVHLVVVEGAPGIGKSTLAWELCRKWPHTGITEAILTSSAPQTTRGRSAVSHRHE